MAFIGKVERLLERAVILKGVLLKSLLYAGAMAAIIGVVNDFRPGFFAVNEAEVSLSVAEDSYVELYDIRDAMMIFLPVKIRIKNLNNFKYVVDRIRIVDARYGRSIDELNYYYGPVFRVDGKRVRYIKVEGMEIDEFVVFIKTSIDKSLYQDLKSLSRDGKYLKYSDFRECAADKGYDFAGELVKSEIDKKSEFFNNVLLELMSGEDRRVVAKCNFGSTHEFFPVHSSIIQ